MMLLNLTSPQMQKDLRQHVLLGAVRLVTLSLIGVAILGVAVAAVGAQQLGSRASSVKQEADQSTLLFNAKTEGSVATVTQRLNSQIRALLAIQKRYVTWTPLIQHVSSITPNTVTLNSVNCSVSTGKCSLVGIASTRESYTAYEKILEESPYFSEVVFPLVTKRTSIDFNVTVKALPAI